jgi:dephospho-CoA kinase
LSVYAKYCGAYSLKRIGSSLMNAPSKAFALTGGIACGKSTVAEILARRGWQVIDTDVIGHELLKTPDMPVWKKVVDAFGPSVLNADRSIDRRVLGDLVFADPEKRQTLNALVHPAIRAQWQATLARSDCTAHPVVVMIPLLYETQAQAGFAKVIAVGCTPATQGSRLAARGLNARQIEQRIASQLTTDEKLRRAAVALWNEGTVGALERQVGRFTASL